MISPRHTLLGLALLSSTAVWSAPPRQDAPSRQGDWLSYAKRSAVGWQVWGFEESRGSAELVTELSAFGAIRLVGYAAKDRLRLDMPALVGADTPVPHVDLVGDGGSVYLARAAGETGLLLVRDSSPAKWILRVPDAPSATPGLVPEVHVAPGGGHLVAVSPVEAGGDVFRVDLNEPFTVTTVTDGLAALDVAPESLRVGAETVWFVADGELYRWRVQIGGSAAIVDLGTDEAVNPELLLPTACDDVVALAEKSDGKRRPFLVPVDGAPESVREDFQHLSAPNLEHPLGPFLAVAPDAALVAYRRTGGSHELHVWRRAEPAATRHLTANPDFPAYIDSVGVLAFGAARVLCFIAGDESKGDFVRDEELGAADMYAADFTDGDNVTIQNVTRTNGAATPPFVELSTLRLDVALVDPPVERFFLVGASVDGGRRLSCFRLDGGEYHGEANEQVMGANLAAEPLLLRTTAGTAIFAADQEPWPPFAQDEDKVICTGDPGGAPLVRVVVCNNEDPLDPGAKVWFDGPVGLGQTFELDAAATGDAHLPSDTWLHVLGPDDALLQSVRFHTSCSQPLRLGDRLGASLLIDTVGEDDPEDGDYCPYGSKPSRLLLCYTGESCGATEHSQDSGKVTCDGDPDAAPLVRIRASDKGDPLDEGARVWFEGFVELGAAFAADAAVAGESRLTNDTYLHVHDPAGELLQTVKLHTSCSQPMKEGDQYGSLALLACELEEGPDPEDLCALGRPRRMTLQYLGHGCGPVVAAPSVTGQRRVGAETGFPRGKGIGGSFEPPADAALRYALDGRSQSRVGLVLQVPGAGPEVWSYDVELDTLLPVEVAHADETIGDASAWSPSGRVVFARRRPDGQFELVLARHGSEQVVDVAADELLPLAD